jgi:hypothetical protein
MYVHAPVKVYNLQTQSNRHWTHARIEAKVLTIKTAVTVK